MIMEEPLPAEMIFKIIVLGDSSSGKTNIITRYIQNKFIGDSQPTIGVEMFVKEFNFNDDKVTAQIWDTAGQEKYNTLTSSYYKGAKGAFIVYDISLKSSFLKVEKIVDDLKEKSEKNVYMVLVGNKIDLEEKREVTKEEGKNLADKLKMGFCEVSAKNGMGIEDLFKNLVDKVYKKHNREFRSFASIEIDDSNKFGLTENNSNTDIKKKKKYCC